MSLSTEIDFFTFENKMRAMVQELIAPTIRRTIDTLEVAEQVQKHDGKNTERLDTLEFNVARLMSRVPLLDDLNKHVLELQADKQANESLINMKHESMMSQLHQNHHENENLAHLTKANEEAITALKTDVLMYTESLNGVKDIIMYENSLVSKKLEMTRMQAKEMWDMISQQIRKVEAAVDNCNNKALPSMTADTEMLKRKIEEDREEFLQRIDLMISFEEFEKFGRSLKFEIEKTHQNFKKLVENGDKVEEYLNHYLPIECWGMVSEAISYLEPKVLAKFVEFDVKTYETLKMDIEFDFLDIDGLSKRAMDSYEEGQKRIESLKTNVLEAIKKDRKISKKPTKHSKPTKSIQKPQPEKKTIENSLSTVEETKEKSSEKRAKKTEEIPEKKGKRTEEKKDNKIIIEKAVINERVTGPDRSPTMLVENEDKKLNEEGSKTLLVENLFLDSRRSSRKSILVLDADPSSLYLPSRPVSRSSRISILSNKIDSEGSNSDTDSPNLSHYNMSGNTSPIVDPAKLESDLEAIRNLIAALEIRTNASEATVQANSNTLSVTLDRFSQDLGSNFSLMHGEIKLLLQKNKQNKNDVSKTLKAFQAELKERDKTVERVDRQFGNVSELVGTLVEFCKVVHLILAQEEEDRENLNLIGFSDNSSKSQPKGYLSLKSECMSCTGNSTLVMSAFKMACINYNPSPIKYTLRTFTRKQLISVMGSFINDSWRSASAKPPYDLIPPPTMSTQTFTTEAHKRKNRYFKSQYFELPSLNTSKQILDINDSLHSYREFKP